MDRTRDPEAVRQIHCLIFIIDKNTFAKKFMVGQNFMSLVKINAHILYRPQVPSQWVFFTTLFEVMMDS